MDTVTLMSRGRLTLVLLALYGFLLAYTATMLLLGQTFSPIMTPLSSLGGFAFALSHVGQRLGWGRALGLLAMVFLFGLTLESVGVATGLVYGPYHYTPKLGPMFLDLVPYLIVVAWFMMMYPSFIIADCLVPCVWGRWLRLIAVAAVGGMVVTAWDVVMDSMMVRGGYWVWDAAGPFFGIPLQNFSGWWLTVFTTLALYQLWAGKDMRSAYDAHFDELALASYAFTGLGGPALAGFFAMAPWIFVGWIRLSRGDQTA